MNESDHKTMLTDKEAFHVGYFRPEDAEGIVQLFQAVYGGNYPIRLFYDPEAIVAANEEGSYYSIVARTPSGRVIGADHFVRSAPYPNLYEQAAGLVLKEYRTGGVVTEMMRFMYDVFVPAKPNIEETWGEAVCYHPYIQQITEKFKHIWTAMEVALMPAETYGKEKNTSERVATVNGFRCFRKHPHEIFLPAVYEKELRWIYSRLEDVRDIRLSEAEPATGTATQADVSTFESANVSRIMVKEIGADFPQCLDNLEQDCMAKKTVVFQVYLNLACPWVGEAVDELRRRGYFFSGAFPRWFDSDGFMMQKLLCPPDFDAIILVTDDAKQLLEMIRKDFDRPV